MARLPGQTSAPARAGRQPRSRRRRSVASDDRSGTGRTPGQALGRPRRRGARRRRLRHRERVARSALPTLRDRRLPRRGRDGGGGVPNGPPDGRVPVLRRPALLGPTRPRARGGAGPHPPKSPHSSTSPARLRRRSALALHGSTPSRPRRDGAAHDFFRDVAGPILATHGQIYQYVGSAGTPVLWDNAPGIRWRPTVPGPPPCIRIDARATRLAYHSGPDGVWWTPAPNEAGEPDRGESSRVTCAPGQPRPPGW